LSRFTDVSSRDCPSLPSTSKSTRYLQFRAILPSQVWRINSVILWRSLVSEPLLPISLPFVGVSDCGASTSLRVFLHKQTKPCRQLRANVAGWSKARIEEKVMLLKATSYSFRAMGRFALSFLQYPLAGKWHWESALSAVVG